MEASTANTSVGTVVFTTNTTTGLDQPPAAAEEQQERHVQVLDARLVGELATFAGRPWCLKPEAMDVLAGALSAGIIAGPAPQAVAEASEEKTIAVIPLHGLITPKGAGVLGALLGMGGGLQQFRSDLMRAARAEGVQQIVLDVDSPGGLTDHVPETASLIRKVREEKPITAVASTQAASAAYWLASQADQIVVTPSGEVGSIGAYMLHADQSRAVENQGLRVSVVSAGKYKTEGNKFEPLSESAREAMQAKVDGFYEMFVNDVAAGRKVTPEQVKEGFGEGRTVGAKASIEEGLADRVATLPEVVTEIGEDLLSESAGVRTRRLSALSLGIVSDGGHRLEDDGEIAAQRAENRRQ